MYHLLITTQFKKDLKKLKKRKADFELTTKVLRVLQQKGVKGIPLRMRPHRLSGKFADNWECHLKPDLLIIWMQFESPKTIRLVRIGSHSELFR
jgi:mRNA interferase YafQ